MVILGETPCEYVVSPDVLNWAATQLDAARAVLAQYDAATSALLGAVAQFKRDMKTLEDVGISLSPTLAGNPAADVPDAPTANSSADPATG
ncbi:MAG: hypothetical protein ACI92Z_003096 [Paracoccaceae bacterium]|jgi:hypothetical protein